jgi:hypothetical protein
MPIRYKLLNVIQLYDLVLKQKPEEEENIDLNIYIDEFIKVLEVSLLNIVQKRLKELNN